MMRDKSKGKPIPNDLKVVNDFRVRGKETPLQNQVWDFIKNHPNCTISDIYKDKILGKKDHASLRNVMRKMIESHRVVQRFTIP